MTLLRWTAGLLLAVLLSTNVNAQGCTISDRQATVNAKVYSALKGLPSTTQYWTVEQAGCKTANMPLEKAIAQCSCNPKFGCAVISKLALKGIIRPPDPFIMACQQGF